MCLAIPAYVEQLIAENHAVVNLCGVRKDISLALVDDVAPGDYVIIHAGFALQKLDRLEAAHTLALFEEMAAYNKDDI
ncbi:MAG: HypC/HybG/HupF family hydrogenase formation chaperone [Nitrosomonas sp.]|nr:MAG: HypC/HybG/HupF family hydrogenase formation chaperone [Nitrosomonas sp.]